MTDANLPEPPGGNDPGDRRNNTLLGIVAAVVVLIGLALALAIFLGRSTGDGDITVSGDDTGSPGTVVADGDVELGSVVVTGDALPEHAGGSPDAAVGVVAPDLAGQDFAGQPASISNDGRPKVVMFLAHWCPHCQREVPRVQGWLDENGMPTGVSLYAVPTATSEARSNYPPSDWLVGAGWTVPVLVDDAAGSAAAAWGLRSYPYFVAVAADGTVVERASGELSEAEFYALVDAARAG